MKTFFYTTVFNSKVEKFSSRNKDALIQDVKAFFEKNNIIFDQHALSAAIDRQSKIKTRPKKLSFADVVAGAKATIKYASGASVSNQEVHRRSAICSVCPLLSGVSDCMSCGGAGKIARFANKIRSFMKSSIKVPGEIEKGYCGFCKCSLLIMTATPLNDFHSESDTVNKTRPDACWLKRTSTNFTKE